MTEEKKLNLFHQVETLISIYDQNNPLHNDGTFDRLALGKTYTQMMDFIIDDADMLEDISGWMRCSSFFKDPASTNYHGNFECGLAVHTMQVIIQSLRLAKPFLTQYFASPNAYEYDLTALDIFISALVHDFCKIGQYEIYQKNVKDDNGNWIKQDAYKYRSDSKNLGHGNESVLILLKILPQYINNRTVLEAISRHMGFSDLSSSESMNYSNFLHNPLVMLLQTADQMASFWYNT